jgi:putative addiction module killer protein
VRVRIRTTRVYLEWINALKDAVTRARIQMRVDRLVHGNPGKTRRLTSGVWEMKLDFGPGYRVYYTKRAGAMIVLLAGGDKSTQEEDIRTAIGLAENLGDDLDG